MYGKILRVDLTKERIDEEPIPREWQVKYVGGEGINDMLFWEHFLRVDPKIDPLSFENVLICGIGPLGATGALGAGTKVKWTFKSPLLNTFGDSVGGGFFGPQLRWAGYDHIVITGKARRPVYLWVSDEGAEIRDAAKLWGKDIFEADALLKEELGYPEVKAALISQAGENLVRYASIIMDRYRAAGRLGGGCVMGSKNLKGVAARGTRGVRIFDPEKFFLLLDEMIKLHQTSSTRKVLDRLTKQGTPHLIEFYQLEGAHPWHNHQSNTIPDEVYPRLRADYLLKHFKTRDFACSAGCTRGCSQFWRIKDVGTPASAKYAGEFGEKPEYIVMAGCLCWGADDLAAICHIHKLWDRLGVDGADMGEAIGFIMELYQRGIITETDIEEWTGEPWSLNWGDYEVVERITESVVFKRNKLYDLLSRGSYEAAKMIESIKGFSVMQYCQYGGKHGTEPEDTRNRRTWQLAMATSTRGADHLKGTTFWESLAIADLPKRLFGSPQVANRLVPHLKGVATVWGENFRAAKNLTGICSFNIEEDNGEVLPRACTAVTGVESDDFMLVGERVCNIEKAFNSRAGFNRKDDSLCDRWMNEPIPEGKYGAGMKAGDYFDLMLDEYYEYRGWDPETGLQTRAKLEELGLKEIADVLEQENALSPSKPQPKEEVLAKARKKADDFAENVMLQT